MSAMEESREHVFGTLYDAHFDAVLGYALRRTARAEDAADIVSETFLVAWRRLQHVPRDAAQLPGLYGVARRATSWAPRSPVPSRAPGSTSSPRPGLPVTWKPPEVPPAPWPTAAGGQCSGR